MKTIKSELIAFFDVDDTLIMWSGSFDFVTIVDPHTGVRMEVSTNRNNITLLKEKASRGFKVIVWSQGGYAWAEAVVKALGLESQVDYVMSKPTTYVDDLTVNTWFPQRVWLDPKRRYKS